MALQCVQSKRRLVHILHLAGLIERRKDQPQPVDLIGSHLASVVLLKQVPEALVFEAPDQSSNCKTSIDVCQLGRIAFSSGLKNSAI
jgi:hypothetical protein